MTPQQAKLRWFAKYCLPYRVSIFEVLNLRPGQYLLYRVAEGESNGEKCLKTETLYLIVLMDMMTDQEHSVICSKIIHMMIGEINFTSSFLNVKLIPRFASTTKVARTFALSLGTGEFV